MSLSLDFLLTVGIILVLIGLTVFIAGPCVIGGLSHGPEFFLKCVQMRAEGIVLGIVFISLASLF